jgi:hypothetical protein
MEKLDQNSNNVEIVVLNDIDNNLSVNETIENSINIIDLESDKNKINQDPNSNEIIIELPIKKKKGRKSKKIKQLEFEQEKQAEPVRRFPKLSEKIFDVLKINGTEYFYDKDFNLLLDSNVIPVGFKHDKKFVFYSETMDHINMVKKDDNEVKNIQKIFTFA